MSNIDPNSGSNQQHESSQYSSGVGSASQPPTHNIQGQQEHSHEQDTNVTRGPQDQESEQQAQAHHQQVQSHQQQVQLHLHEAQAHQQNLQIQYQTVPQQQSQGQSQVQHYPYEAAPYHYQGFTYIPSHTLAASPPFSQHQQHQQHVQYSVQPVSLPPQQGQQPHLPQQEQAPPQSQQVLAQQAHDHDQQQSIQQQQQSNQQQQQIVYEYIPFLPGHIPQAPIPTQQPQAQAQTQAQSETGQSEQQHLHTDHTRPHETLHQMQIAQPQHQQQSHQQPQVMQQQPQHQYFQAALPQHQQISHVPIQSTSLGAGVAHPSGTIIFHSPPGGQIPLQQQQGQVHLQQGQEQQTVYASTHALPPQHFVQTQHGQVIYHPHQVVMGPPVQQGMQSLAPIPGPVHQAMEGQQQYHPVTVPSAETASPSQGDSPSRAAQANKRPWTKEEDDLLLKLVKTHGTKDWTSICAGIPHRNRKQCRERYKNHLDGHVKKGAWTQEEDNLIFEWQKKVGNKWSVIAQYLPNRTDNAVKNRFWSATRSRQRKAKKDAKKRAIAAKAQEIEDEQKHHPGKRARTEVGQDISSASPSHLQAEDSPEHASAGSFHTAASVSPHQRPVAQSLPQPLALPQGQVAQYQYVPQQYQVQQSFQAQEGSSFLGASQGYDQSSPEQQHSLAVQPSSQDTASQQGRMHPFHPTQMKEDPEEDRKPPAR